MSASATHPFPTVVPAPGSVQQTAKQTVFDLVGMAQGWHERAVILRLLAHHVSRICAGDRSEYLVKRISGVAHPASEAQVAAIASELRDAAAAAQEQAKRILNTAVGPVEEGSVPGLSERWAAVVRSSALELADLDSCAVPRTDNRLARRPAVVTRAWRA